MMEQKLENLEAGMNTMQNQMAEEKECSMLLVASIMSLMETLRHMEGRLDSLEQNRDCNCETRSMEVVDAAIAFGGRIRQFLQMRMSRWAKGGGCASQTSGGNSRFLCFTEKMCSLGSIRLNPTLR